MAKVILHKGFNPNALPNGYWFWSEKEVRNDFGNIYTEPYVVEIPDEFELCETVSGEERYFKDGCDTGFEIGSIHNTAHCSPYLIGTELVKLKVIGLADESGNVDLNSIRAARIAAGLSQKGMSDNFEIPLRTLESWEMGDRKPPVYVEKLIIEKLKSMKKPG